MNENQILSAIGSTEPSTFAEFCRELKDCPERGDTAGWREVFTLLDDLAKAGFVEVEKTDGKIDTMILTDAGADRVRGMLDSERGLFREIG